jgi:hypothetical protein
MLEERLNRVATLSIKNEILEKLEYNFIISNFTFQKREKLFLNKKNHI